MKAFKAFPKPFKVKQRSVKMKILVNFFFLSGIGTLKVKLLNQKNLQNISAFEIIYKIQRSW